MEANLPIHLYYPQFASLHQGEDLQLRWKSKDSYVLNLQGWDGMRWAVKFRREGTYVCLIHVVVWQMPIQYYKAIILQLKIN